MRLCALQQQLEAQGCQDVELVMTALAQAQVRFPGYEAPEKEAEASEKYTNPYCAVSSFTAACAAQHG